MSKKKNLTERVKQYVTYLNDEIDQHMFVREERANELKFARDKLYEIFPEIKPARYKTTVLRRIYEKKADLRKLSDC